MCTYMDICTNDRYGHMYMYTYVYMCTDTDRYTYMHIHVHPRISIYFYLSVCLYLYLSIHLSRDLSGPTYLSIYFFCIFLDLSIYPSFQTYRLYGRLHGQHAVQGTLPTSCPLGMPGQYSLPQQPILLRCK